MFVARVMPVCCVIARARVDCGHLQAMLVHVIFMDMVQVSVMDVVDVAVMANCRMPTTDSVLMGMIRMGLMRFHWILLKKDVKLHASRFNGRLPLGPPQ